MVEKILTAAAVGLVALALTGCQATTSSVAALSCNRIAEKAKAVPQSSGAVIDSITDVAEVSTTPNEKRCSGTAHMADRSGTVYFRGTTSDDSVEIRDTPFE